MKITILCNSPNHPVNSHIDHWVDKNSPQHDITITRKISDVPGGDLLFLVSCGEIVKASDRAKYTKTLVLHASDLPTGRGWNPHIWQIINGQKELTVTLLEAEDKVDTGAIWKKVRIAVGKDALWDEINEAVFSAEMSLMDYAVANFETVLPQEQDANQPVSYYRLRNPTDSQIDITQSIESQWDLLRVADPTRYPAFFEIHDHKYFITIRKADIG